MIGQGPRDLIFVPGIISHVEFFHDLRTAGDGVLACFGEIECRSDDVAGLAVHIGAHVQAAAAPAEVLVSRTVKDLVVGSGFTFVDRGTHALKGQTTNDLRGLWPRQS